MSDFEEKDESQSSYFDKYEFEKFGNLTGKIKSIEKDITNNKLRNWREIKEVFNYIVKNYFDGNDPREMKTSYNFKNKYN